MSRKLLNFDIASRLVLLTLAIPLASCHKAETASTPKAFATPGAAGEAVQASAKSGNQDELIAIFGPDAKQLLYSGDPVQDKNALQSFTAGYGVMHRWRKMKDGSQTLLVGADNFPFPIPLKKNSSGQWVFDTAAGKNEVLNRRIGRNELAVIDVCNALVDAEGQYYSQPHEGVAKGEFALKFISDPGKQNGLYWKSDDGQPESPLGPQVTQAAAEGYSKNANGPTPFHGYLFKILTGQSAKAPGGAKDYVVNGKMVGGFAFVAYQASYGDSGIMTFITNQDGLLLQKDLGANTAQVASAMTIYDPDTGWDPIPEPPEPQ
jgi:hypothetical protein